MHGEIVFDSLDQLGEFLRAFCPSTATFEVGQICNGNWVLTFTGGF